MFYLHLILFYGASMCVLPDSSRGSQKIVVELCLCGVEVVYPLLVEQVDVLVLVHGILR